MYTKTELFNDIVSILKNDYAGYEDKKKYNYPERYTVTNNMDDATFTQTIQEYLYGFKDGHLSFRNKKVKCHSVAFVYVAMKMCYMLQIF